MDTICGFKMNYFNIFFCLYLKNILFPECYYVENKLSSDDLICKLFKTLRALFIFASLALLSRKALGRNIFPGLAEAKYDSQNTPYGILSRKPPTLPQPCEID